MRIATVRRIAFISVVLIAVASTAPVATRAQGGHDLQIVNVANTQTAVTGTQVMFTMTVKNNGPLPAAQANVSTGAPAGTEFVSVTHTAGTVDESPLPGGTGELYVSLGSMAVNQVETVVVTLRIVATPGSTVTVTSGVQPLNPMGDPAQSNNNSAASVQVVAPTTADLALQGAGDEASAGSGSPFVYNLTVTNPSLARSPRDPAISVAVLFHVPEGSGFASVSTSQGDSDTPEIGERGLVMSNLGVLEEGQSATVEVTVNVTAAPGANLSVFSRVITASTDPNPDNNYISLSTPVVDNGTATLAWEPPPPPTASLQLPPPLRLEVERSGAPAVAGRVADPRVTLLRYNVYRSNSPGVVPSPGTYFTSVPAGTTSTSAPVAPGGTFFTVTSEYDEGESGPSNEGSADVEAGTITTMKVKSTKIQATGNGFSNEVTVLVDGIPFVSAAAVKKQGTKVVQKGNLLTGQSIGAYLAANPNVLISIRNSNGGVVTWRHPQ